MQGGCLCGQVRYEAANLRETVTACHCGQCRRVSGNYWAATRAMADEIEISGAVSWFRSSEKAERGFCATCGSALFYRPIGAEHIAVAAGSVDMPTGMTLTHHIYVNHKADWYEIAGDIPQRED